VGGWLESGQKTVGEEAEDAEWGKTSLMARAVKVRWQGRKRT